MLPLNEIKAHTSDIAVIVGAPAQEPKPEGKDLFNAAWFLHENEVKAVVQKHSCPPMMCLMSTVILNRHMNGK